MVSSQILFIGLKISLRLHINCTSIWRVLSNWIGGKGTFYKLESKDILLIVNIYQSNRKVTCFTLSTPWTLEHQLKWKEAWKKAFLMSCVPDLKKVRSTLLYLYRSNTMKIYSPCLYLWCLLCWKLTQKSLAKLENTNELFDKLIIWKN